MAVFAVFAVAAMMADTAQADGGPHRGTFGATSSACASCHRLHTGQAPKLLKESQATLCMSCHNGTGSSLNVADGVDTDAAVPEDGGLRGGGFVNTMMDTNRDGVIAAAAATSAHSTDGSSQTAWGNGAIGSGAGGTIALTCGNCHNPHGNGNYRILRAEPRQSGAGSDVVLPDDDPATRVYTITYTASGFRDVSYASTDGKDFSAWCAQCHTRHLAPSDSGETDSGDPIYAYRHMTDGLTDGCLKCHVAHGTSAAMDHSALTLPYPDGTDDGNQNSRLLHVDGRGVCLRCHNPGGD